MNQLNLSKLFLTLIAGLSLLFISCSDGDNNDLPSPARQSPVAILASTPWITTVALNSQGERLSVDDPRVSGYVGYAYYHTDGTFRITGLDNKNGSYGTWSISEDGKTRTLIGERVDNGFKFERNVEILELTNDVFTYRIIPNDNEPNIYYDIVHTPTSKVEPTIPSEILASTAWVTTEAIVLESKNANYTKDQDVTTTIGAGFVGYAYYNLASKYGGTEKVNGDFVIYGLDDTERSSGTWFVNLAGTQRTLTTPAFTRTVDIDRLTANEFDYIISVNPNNEGEVILLVKHIKTDHKQP